jgi:hypothetical protein
VIHSIILVKVFMLYYRILDTAIFVFSACSTYLFWVLLHFIAAQIYLRHCVGSSWVDLLYSVIFVSSPYCQGLSWIIYHGSQQISAMWFVFGTYISNKLLTQYIHKEKIS